MFLVVLLINGFLLFYLYSGYHANTHPNVLAGIVDAAVNGGTKQYEEAFLIEADVSILLFV